MSTTTSIQYFEEVNRPNLVFLKCNGITWQKWGVFYRTVLNGGLYVEETSLEGVIQKSTSASSDDKALSDIILRRKLTPIIYVE